MLPGQGFLNLPSGPRCGGGMRINVRTKGGRPGPVAREWSSAPNTGWRGRLRSRRRRWRAAHDVDNLAMAISLIASTGGVGLAPAYIQRLLPATLVTRPLQGEAPTIDLVVGYLETNRSPSLKAFLSELETLISRVSKP